MLSNGLSDINSCNRPDAVAWTCFDAGLARDFADRKLTVNGKTVQLTPGYAAAQKGFFDPKKEDMSIGADYGAGMVYDYNAGGNACSQPIEFVK